MKTSAYSGATIRKKEFLFHGLFWLLFIYFKLVQFDFQQTEILIIKKLSVFEISGGIIFIATFYFNYLLVLPQVFKKINWKRILIGVITVYLFFITLRYLLEEILISLFIGHGNYFEGTSVIYYVYDNLYYGSFSIIISSILWILFFNMRLLEYNNHILEEKRNTEVKFLKAQLNPHFLFNTLNNIYSLVYFKSDKSLPAIEKLSELMRYTTYETTKEKINLQQEIDYIKAYIELNQLRHENKVVIDFKAAIENPSVQIPPFLLSPLIENALKHGFYTENHPIMIKLKQTTNNLSLKVVNKISQTKKDKLGGIGLDNLKKNLEINYPGAHSLNLVNEEETFSVQLDIKINGKQD